MAAKNTAFARDILALIYNGTAITDLAQDDGSGPLTKIYVAFHTANPIATPGTATQATSECAYTGYSRVETNRATGAGGWTLHETAASVSPGSVIEAPECTGAPCVITHWSTGVASSGATKILHSGTVTPNISVVVGTIPRLKTTTTITES